MPAPGPHLDLHKREKKLMNAFGHPSLSLPVLRLNVSSNLEALSCSVFFSHPHRVHSSRKYTQAYIFPSSRGWCPPRAPGISGTGLPLPACTAHWGRTTICRGYMGLKPRARDTEAGRTPLYSGIYGTPQTRPSKAPRFRARANSSSFCPSEVVCSSVALWLRLISWRKAKLPPSTGGEREQIALKPLDCIWKRVLP